VYVLRGRSLRSLWKRRRRRRNITVMEQQESEFTVLKASEIILAL
jgi:hypothetical protein